MTLIRRFGCPWVWTIDPTNDRISTAPVAVILPKSMLLLFAKVTSAPPPPVLLIVMSPVRLLRGLFRVMAALPVPVRLVFPPTVIVPEIEPATGTGWVMAPAAVTLRFPVNP